MQIAVHESIAENYMTPLGIAFGNPSGDYIHLRYEEQKVAGVIVYAPKRFPQLIFVRI